MKVLVCGADGFLGRHIVEALRARGYHVVRGVRRVKDRGDVAVDYRIDLDPAVWRPRLAGVEAVVNAVGILNERTHGDFDRIHYRAPAALFRACADAGVHRVVQISALGTTATPYLSSKRAADKVLLELVPEAVVLRPGLVFGREGASTLFFLALASLPLRARLGGAGEVQPVHVADLSETVARLVDGGTVAGGVLEMPGPTRLEFDDWLAAYRAGLGLAPAIGLPLPAAVTSLAARVAGLFPASLLSPASWAMLKAGNVGDHRPASALLRREPAPPTRFIEDKDREWLRLRALAAWRNRLARAVVAVIWLGSALVSAGLYPIEDSLARLLPFGLSGPPALAALASAIALDLVLGLLTCLRPGRRLWQAQLAVIALYTALVLWRLPGYLLDPFGPILKNLAVMALVFQLWSEETAS